MSTQEIATIQTPLTLIETTDINKITETLKKVSIMQSTIKGLLKEGHDFGLIPGCGDKPTLYKPGAEKILMAFGLTSEYELVERTESFEGIGFFAYTVKCKLSHNGAKITEGLGHANTKEPKWAYKWVYENKIPDGFKKEDLPKKENKSRTGSTYFTYRIDEDANGKANTILKMAKKRAQIDAVLTVASLSELFTQDLEDLSANGNIVQPDDNISKPTILSEDKAKILHKILDNHEGVQYELCKKYEIDTIEALQTEKFFAFKKEAEKAVKEWDEKLQSSEEPN